MFDLSFTEMILAGTVALIVLGPERLPKVARTIGRLVGKIQNFTTTMKQEFTSQNENADLMKIKNDVESAAQNIRNEINDFEQQIQKENQEIGRNDRRRNRRPRRISDVALTTAHFPDWTGTNRRQRFVPFCVKKIYLDKFPRNTFISAATIRGRGLFQRSV